MREINAIVTDSMTVPKPKLIPKIPNGLDIVKNISVIEIDIKIIPGARNNHFGLWVSRYLRCLHPSGNVLK